MIKSILQIQRVAERIAWLKAQHPDHPVTLAPNIREKLSILALESYMLLKIKILGPVYADIWEKKF